MSRGAFSLCEVHNNATGRVRWYVNGVRVGREKFYAIKSDGDAFAYRTETRGHLTRFYCVV